MTDAEIADPARRFELMDKHLEPRFIVKRSEDGCTSIIDQKTGEDFGRLVVEARMTITLGGIAATFVMSSGTVGFEGYNT